MQNNSLMGLDLGTSTIVVASLDEFGVARVLPNRDGELSTPSCIFFEDNGPIYGMDAFHAGLADPSQCILNAKRWIGSDEVLWKGAAGNKFTGIDIVGLLAKRMKKRFEQTTGHPIEYVGWAVPANFPDNKRASVIQMAKKSGFENVALFSEPVAAAIANGVLERGPCRVLVVDIGGGTTDVAVIDVSGSHVETLATRGLERVGGMDFTKILEDHVLGIYKEKYQGIPSLEEDPMFHQEVWLRAEHAKKSLASRSQTTLTIGRQGDVISVTLTPEYVASLFAQPFADVFSCIDQVLKEASIEVTSCKDCLLVGGGAQVAGFADAFQQRYGCTPYYKVDPHHAVARGALLMLRARLEQEGERLHVGDRSLPPLNVRVRDTTTYPIGVCTLDENNRTVNTVILEKGAPIPSDHMRAFKLAESGQTNASITVLQGEDGVPASDCVELGTFELEGLTPVLDSPHQIDIRLRITNDGVLKAEALDAVSHVVRDLDISYKDGTKSNPSLS
jgi:molecular chaperone DnaK